MSFWPQGDDDDEDDSDHSVDIKSEEEEVEVEEYMDEQNIEEQIVCLKAEYAFQMSKNSQLQRELEKTNVRIRRRQKIVEYYDDYIFNYVFDDDKEEIKKNKLKPFNISKYEESIDIIDIDKDYKNVIRIIQIEETRRLEEEEEEEWRMYQLSHNDYRPNSFNNFNKPKHQSSMTIYNYNVSSSISFGGGTRMRSKSAAHVMHANILYQVSPEEQIIEKQWMRQLRKRKFKIFVNKHRKQKLQKLKKSSEQKLKELEQQIAMKQRIEKLNNLRNKLDILKKSRITFIQNTSKELDLLRSVIYNLYNK